MLTVKAGNVTWDLSITVFHVKTLRDKNPPILLTDANVLANILQDAVAMYDLLCCLLNRKQKRQVSTRKRSHKFSLMTTKLFQKR